MALLVYRLALFIDARLYQFYRFSAQVTDHETLRLPISTSNPSRSVVGKDTEPKNSRSRLIWFVDGELSSFYICLQSEGARQDA